MIQPAGLDHIVLRVSSFDASIAFYCGALGCTVLRRRDELGLIHLRAGRALIDLVSLDGKLGRVGGVGPGDEGRNLDHFCLRLETFDQGALLQHLRSAGIPASNVEPRFGAEGVGPSLYVTDPDGNIVELKGPPAPAGDAAGSDGSAR